MQKTYRVARAFDASLTRPGVERAYYNGYF